MPSLKCVVIDDDRDWHFLVRRAIGLVEASIDVVPFVDAEAALDHLRGSAADLIVSDLHMPGMNGLMFARELREFNRTTPLILISSDVPRHDEIFAAGVDQFVPKGELNRQLPGVVIELLGAEIGRRDE